jgi:hypothetical protein
VKRRLSRGRLFAREERHVTDQGFFREIEHREVPWGDRTVHVPVFYHDATTISALFTAEMERIREVLPSSRMHPIRVAPRRCLLSILAHEFRASDIGPYNEVGVAVPFTLDRPVPVLRTLLGHQTREPMIYIHRLPVTTEIACALGVEFAGYPKFIAEINCEEQEGWRTAHLAEGAFILTLRGRMLRTRNAPRGRVHCFTVRNGRLLRSEMIVSERSLGSSKNGADVALELGDHPIARELRSLNLGAAVSYTYTPRYQIILTPVIESLPSTQVSLGRSA